MTTTNTITPVKPERKKSKVAQAIAFYIREFIAAGFWLLLFVKVFVFDVDLAVVHVFPRLAIVYPYKFFFILGFLAVSWITLGTKRFLKTIGYVLIYPFVLFLWRVPKQLFKNWALLVIFAPAIESVLFTLKWRFAFATAAVFAALTILNTEQHTVLVVSMSVLMVYLLVHYLLRLKVAFRPTALFSNIADFVNDMWRGQIDDYKRKDYAAHTGAGPQQGEAYEKKRIENLKTLYLHTVMWSFFAKKLNETVSSRRTDLYFILAVLYSVVLSVLILGFEYAALAKVDPNSFRGAENANLWSFMVFSFNTIMHTGFTRIAPNSDWAFALGNLELFAGIITLIFFVYVLMTSSKERYREDFKRLVHGLDQSSKEIERFFEKKLRMRLIDAEVKLVEHDPTFRETIKSFGRPRLLWMQN